MKYNCNNNSDDLFLSIIAALIFLMISLFTFVSNVLVMITFVCSKKLHSPSNYFFASLAVTDAFIGLITTPYYFTEWSLIRHYGYSYNNTNFFQFSRTMGLILTGYPFSVSLFHLMAITIDRYLTLTSIRYSLTRNSKRILKMIAFAWIIPFVLLMPPHFGLFVNGEFIVYDSRGICSDNNLSPVYRIILHIANNTVVFSTLYFNWRIYKVMSVLFIVILY